MELEAMSEAFLGLHRKGKIHVRQGGPRTVTVTDIIPDETMMTIHFQADLRPIVGQRVGMLHWLMDPLVAGFIIAYELSGNAVLISNFDGDKHPVQTWNENLCLEVVRSSLGKKRQDIPLRIHSYRPWLLSRKVADSYRMGNVFLAGDAAHSFPPTGGLGLNSGLADVHNLAYKIAAVHQGWAADTILDTYQDDRRHVALVNSQQSVKNGKKIFGLLKTLGTGGTQDLQEARRNLMTTVNDPAKIAMIDEGVQGQREHFDNLELHIGYVYGSSMIPPNASNYHPKYIAGARLPHTWITVTNPSVVSFLPKVDTSYITEFTTSEISSRTYSSLDLCALDAFTFIINASSVDAWAERIKTVRSRYEATGCKFNVVCLGRDFNIIAGSGTGEKWAVDAGLIGANGGLLIRPDQHILMRLEEQMTADEVLTSLRSHLGL